MTLSNYYADSIFTDSPTAVWTFDEQITGTVSVSTDIEINGDAPNVLTTEAYADLSNSGYFVSSDSTLANVLVTNSGAPLTYGSSGIANLNDGNGLPSIILPAFGFLNNVGISKNITVEFWMRANSNNHYPQKIMGPINSDDGLYINGGFFTLKINDYIGSHYVGNFNRPLLVHVVYTPNYASLIVNGEQVVTLSINSNNLVFPEEITSSSKNQNYIGFYSSSTFSLMQVDCAAIYSYAVQESIAKLHFIKGQSIESPEIRQGKFSAMPVIFDSQMSEVANKFFIPGTGRWQNGQVDNLDSSNDSLSAPLYKLPSVIFEDSEKTLEEWNVAQNEITDQQATETLSDGDILNDNVWFEINPKNTDDEWASEGYIYFDRFSNIIQDQVKSFYGVFEVYSLPATDSEEILIRLSSRSNEYFESVVNSSGSIIYRFVSNSEEILSQTITGYVTVGQKFVVGVDIDSLVSYQDNILLTSFLNNPESLQVFVGGSSSFSKTFNGKIYKIGFCNNKALSILKDVDPDIFVNGVVDNSFVSTFNSYFASYTLFGINTFGVFSLDIATYGSWKDYVPLSLLAKTNDLNDYKIDYVQVNVDSNEFSNVTNSVIRSYAEFSEVAISVVSDLQISKTKEAISANYSVEPDDQWRGTLYEFVDGTAINLPADDYDDINDLAINIYLDVYIPGIIRNPVNIKRLSIIAQSLNEDKTYIGTKIERKVFPYTKSIANATITTSYSSYNPFVINNESIPYLYLTKNSGIKMVGSNVGSVISTSQVEQRGISIPLNSEKRSSYGISLVQMALRYDGDTANKEIFRVSDIKNNEVIIFKTDSSSNIVATSIPINDTVSSPSSYSLVEYYVDGIENETIKPYEWQFLTIRFIGIVDLAQRSSSLDLTGPFIYNNITEYLVDQNRIDDNQSLAIWAEYASGTWSDVLALGNWEQALVSGSVSSNVYVDPVKTYSSYLGINRINAYDDSQVFNITQNNSFTYRQGIRDSIYTVTPL